MTHHGNQPSRGRQKIDNNSMFTKIEHTLRTICISLNNNNISIFEFIDTEYYAKHIICINSSLSLVFMQH